MENRNLISGEWRGALDGSTFGVCDAATGREIARVPHCHEMEALEAVEGAANALGAWRSRSLEERAQFLRAIAAALRSHEDQFAHVITAENGKPLSEGRGEVAYSADYFSSAADEALQLHAINIRSRSELRVLRAHPEPIGVVAAITPWNFPLAMMARKTAPALAAGCTQVIKPAELTPLTALLFARVLADLGLPPGVVNVVTGDPAAIGQAWLDDGRVRKLSFTGSTRVGRLLMRGAAEQVVRLSLELGGHAPFIVLRDANVAAAVDAAVAGKFRAAGQTCVCPNRFLIADEIHDEFVERFVTAARLLPVGRGSDLATRVGPLISDEAVARMRRHIDDALAKGATLRTGGSTIAVEGCVDRFFAPTVVTEASSRMVCFQEETFGPLAPIARFHDESHAIQIANETPFGLAAYVFSEDSTRLAAVSEAVNCGIVGANTGIISDAYAPFGGRGWSGFGREGGRWGIEEYLSWKYVCTGVHG